MLTCSFTVGPIFLKDLPDPERCYEGLSSTNNITGVSVFVPDIRDSQGKIIPPMEYEKKFVDSTVVEVEVVPKLYLYRTRVNPYICCILVRTEMGKK